MLYCRRVLFQIICDNHSKSYKRTTHTHSIIIRNTLLARNILHFRPTAAVTFPGCSILETFKAYSLTFLYINERSFARFCSLLFLALGINYFLPLSVCLCSLVVYQLMGVAVLCCRCTSGVMHGEERTSRVQRNWSGLCGPFVPSRATSMMGRNR